MHVKDPWNTLEMEVLAELTVSIFFNINNNIFDSKCLTTLYSFLNISVGNNIIIHVYKNIFSMKYLHVSLSLKFGSELIYIQSFTDMCESTNFCSYSYDQIIHSDLCVHLENNFELKYMKFKVDMNVLHIYLDVNSYIQKKINVKLSNI